MAAHCWKDEIVHEERFAAACPAIASASLPKSADRFRGPKKAIQND
jgi:hypothetical protein